MNATVGSPSEPSGGAVTVASLDEIREVAEDPRASEGEGLRVVVTGVRVNQAEELHALVRDHVEAKLWSVTVDEADAMAALRAAAYGAARLEALSRALDAVVRDTEDGVPVPATGPRFTLLRELAGNVSRRQPPPPFLPRRYAAAGVEAADIGRQAKEISQERFFPDRWTSPESLECSMDYFRQTAEKARARSAALLGMTIPFEDPPIVIHILDASSWEARYYSDSRASV
uniref:Uncharacterized protein n=1 Tax=Oryza punctata TaxID=4537 RepID=A0A0E0MFV7_ORYPU